jgi:hypothetical protein
MINYVVRLADACAADHACSALAGRQYQKSEDLDSADCRAFMWNPDFRFQNINSGMEKAAGK